jgi:hypothetical protein
MRRGVNIRAIKRLITTFTVIGKAGWLTTGTNDTILATLMRTKRKVNR